MISASVFKLRRSNINDSFSCALRDQMNETEQILTGITESHTTTDTGLVVRSGT